MKIRWKVTWKAQERRFAHFHEAYKFAEDLRAAGQKAEIVTVEDEA